MMHNLELILLNIVRSKGILSTYFYTHPGLEYLDKYTWGKRLTLALIGPKYNFSLKLYLLIRGPFWKNISWCKVKIGNSAGKLRYPFPNHCVNLVKKLINRALEDKQPGSIYWYNIYGSFIWNKYQSLLNKLLYTESIIFLKFLEKGKNSNCDFRQPER